MSSPRGLPFLGTQTLVVGLLRLAVPVGENLPDKSRLKVSVSQRVSGAGKHRFASSHPEEVGEMPPRKLLGGWTETICPIA